MNRLGLAKNALRVRTRVTLASILAATAAVALVACGSQNSSGFDRSGGSRTSPNGSTGPDGDGDFDEGATTGEGVEGNECAAVSERAREVYQPADLIWAIDTSGSMLDTVREVRDNMNRFSQMIVDSGIDVRVMMLASPTLVLNGTRIEGVCIAPPLGSGKCDAVITNPLNPPDGPDTKLPNYFHPNVGVGSNDSLFHIVNAFPRYKPYLRVGASKTFIVVTDDENTGYDEDGTPHKPMIANARDFTEAVNKLDPQLFGQGWKFSAIYAYSKCPRAAAEGRVYRNLVSQTGGVSGDICNIQFQPVFNDLARGVIVGSKRLACQYRIPKAPGGQELQPDRVNARYTAGSGDVSNLARVNSAADCGTEDGWYYDDNKNPTTLFTCPKTCDTFQGDDAGKMDILFGCKTRVR